MPMDPRKWRVRKCEGWWWIIPPWHDETGYRTPWPDQAVAMAVRKRGLVERRVPHTPAHTPLPADLKVQCRIDEAAFLRVPKK